MRKALRLDREDVARFGCRITSAPREAKPKRNGKRKGVPSEGWSQKAGRHAPSPLTQRLAAHTLWRRFGDDRDLVGLKVTLLLGIAILTAMLDLAR